MFDHDALIALAEESRALSAALRELEPQDLRLPTNCPPWDLQELVVHIAASISLGDAGFPDAVPHAPLVSAADYYRRPERDTQVYRQSNVDRTQELTRRVLVSTSAARWFDEVSHDSITELSREDLGRIVLIPGRGAMRLADWVVTRVVSVAAHGLDVALTLKRTPWTSPSALHVMRPVFTALLGTEIPAALNWDDQAFLAVATGRRALTGDERTLLGPQAEHFPLLS
ncbi:maleylpyruvate isomerase N-terminal domain-containing protein [Streptosporangium sandarakinum]|uniref:maleylpyruvate isomerase N-terminal domain-containing protein n=1 Tax=Streptosporangium sandarakinum TaxID=1260955 RepID=UPI00368319E2